MLEGWGREEAIGSLSASPRGQGRTLGFPESIQRLNRRGDKERIEGRRVACAVEDPGDTVSGTRSKTMTYILLNVVVEGDRT